MTTKARRRTMVAGLFCVAVARPVATQEAAIRQPVEATPRQFIRRAFEMRDLAVRNGDQAYGAVLVRREVILGQAPSRVVTNKDPTAHAELEAIRDAARRTGHSSFDDAVLYSSSRPCPRCEAAANRAGIARMVWGADLTDGGAPRLSRD
ncbi:MAG TPA: deaminase [Reyranellaceae bacterium]|nr:deaminase [Reyranellaceae bacterium]